MYSVIENGKPRCKISYKLFKEEYGYYPLLDISPFPTSIQLKYFLGGIHHCVTVVGKWIFTVILLLQFLSLNTSYNTVELMTMKQN